MKEMSLCSDRLQVNGRERAALALKRLCYPQSTLDALRLCAQLSDGSGVGGCEKVVVEKY
ncbi:hypothetical protein [Shewanella colwelliana]|uniref:hypothetical protein n=1 Tax=Shewanella colwelliana TaxID=23 RepID=UPI001C7D1C8E|nr:hypothetical protein [Shewanella colwelliana]